LPRIRTAQGNKEKREKKPLSEMGAGERMRDGVLSLGFSGAQKAGQWRDGRGVG
jgi:hypothetical protein